MSLRYQWGRKTIQAGAKPDKTQFARHLRRRMTPAEKVLWSQLRYNKTGVKFRRQAPILIYFADFYSPKANLVVEVDGAYHLYQQGYDERRDKAMNRLGLRVLRFSNSDVMGRLPAVMAKIKSVIREQICL